MNKNTKATQCVHSGSIKDEATKGMVTPIYPSTAYDYVDTEIQAYPRYFNTPNQKVVVEKLCALENGEDGIIFSSGMAAITTVLFSLLKKDDHAVFQNDLYGGTVHAVNHEMVKFGIDFSFTDGNSIDAFEEALKPNTKLIYIETPSNPLMNITDVKAVADLAKSKGIVTVIDNTFASPINQNPIDLGIDVVVHSGTKYLGGHSDICCGAMITSKEICQKVWGGAIHFGGSLSPETCYLLERSLKTLSLRVRQQNENALAIAQFLEDHPNVDRVYYPGLASHPDHELAKEQMNGFTGMFSFEPKGNADDLVKNLKLVSSAMSLGGVETTICSPTQTSHSKMTTEERAKAGIKDQLLRVSVGIEEAQDLIADFEAALSKIPVYA
ncbi:MAG: PLP-dependent aspartate aminotransferase family protein [Bacteroidota bacterium]